MAHKKDVSIRTVENRRALSIKALIAVGFAYAFISFAIDSGSYWHYLLAFVSVGIFINVTGRLVKDIVKSHGNSKK